MSITKFIQTVICFLLLPLYLFSQTIYRCNDGIIQFSSTAVQELINANSNKLAGILNTKNKAFAFVVKISSFEGFNMALQREHFNENYLESSKYPDATFSGKIIEDIDFTKDGIYQVRAKGILTIHNVEQERIIKCKIIIAKGIISAKSDFNVLLRDHDIKVPKVVHEKIASEINVSVTVNLNPEKEKEN